MTIQTVINASRYAPQGALDREIHRSNVIDRFAHRTFVCVYVDVPIDKVVALNRQKGVWNNGETWRQAVGHLIGKGWDATTIAYFDAPLLEKRFPAPESVEPLKLTIIGGACYCSCGNHRLVAGMALLANKGAGQDFLQQVKAYHYTLDAATSDFLRSTADAGADVHTGTISDSRYIFGKDFDIVLHRTDEPQTYYGRGSEGIEKIIEPNRLQKLFKTKLKPPGSACNWIVTPNQVIRQILDDEWILNQLPNARTW